MSFRAKIIIDEIEVNVLKFNFRFKRGADDNGHPCEIPTFRGLEVLIESRSDLNLAEWSFESDMAKQIELHIYPVNLDGRTRKLYFFDSHLIGWKHNFSSTGTLPLTEQLTITAAGVKDSTTEEEYSMYWRTTYPDKEVKPTVIEEEDDDDVTIINCTYSDREGNPLTEMDDGDEITLTVNTEDCVGKNININLTEFDFGFEYKGKVVRDNILKNIKVTADSFKIDLDVIELEDED